MGYNELNTVEGKTMKKYFFAYLAGVRPKYILAWMLGVPVSILVIVYVISNYLR
jgi:hypothetical protein